MNKSQHYKYINNVNNNYNNYNYYNNYYNGYGYRKQYSKNTNSANNNNNNYNNEDRKKNNYYNNYNNNTYSNDLYNNNYLYTQPTKKKKGNRYNNNNFYENNSEEVLSKSVNEIKQKVELLRVKINLRDNTYKELVVYKDDDIFLLVSQFCSDNFINENLIQPLINKIKQSLNELNIITNSVKLKREGVVLLEKAKKLVKNK